MVWQMFHRSCAGLIAGACAFCVLLASIGQVPAWAQNPNSVPPVVPAPENGAKKENPLALIEGIGAADTQYTKSDGVPPTLMFNLEDLMDIRSASLLDQQNGYDPTRILRASLGQFTHRLSYDLYVSSIVYRSPADWMVWINGKAYTRGDKTVLFQINRVTPQFVELIIPWGAVGEQKIQLAPNQTFIAGTGLIAEGRIAR
jgi:hypothetical protein